MRSLCSKFEKADCKVTGTQITSHDNKGLRMNGRGKNGDLKDASSNNKYVT